MELERLIAANTLRKMWEVYMESLQHLDEAYKKNIGLKGLKVYISTADGWGIDGIVIPDNAIPEIFPIIRKALDEKVKELEQQFKDL